MNAWLAMSCLQKPYCHIGPSELKAVALQLKLCSMKWFPEHSTAATDRSGDRGLLVFVVWIPRSLTPSQSALMKVIWFILIHQDRTDQLLITSGLPVLSYYYSAPFVLWLNQIHLSFGLVPDQILWIWQFLRWSKNSTNNIAVTTLKLMLRILQRNP